MKEFIPSQHPLWSLDTYSAFKNSPHKIKTCTDYVNGNFKKHKIAQQNWGFIVQHEGWYRSTKAV